MCLPERYGTYRCFIQYILFSAVECVSYVEARKRLAVRRDVIFTRLYYLVTFLSARAVQCPVGEKLLQGNNLACLKGNYSLYSLNKTVYIYIVFFFQIHGVEYLISVMSNSSVLKSIFFFD